MMFKTPCNDAPEFLTEVFSRIRDALLTTLEIPLIIWLSRNLILITSKRVFLDVVPNYGILFHGN